MFAYVKREVYNDVFFNLIFFIKAVDNGLKKSSSNLTIIYLSNEIWHSYTLSKEDSRNA